MSYFGERSGRIDISSGVGVPDMSHWSAENRESDTDLAGLSIDTEAGISGGKRFERRVGSPEEQLQPTYEMLEGMGTIEAKALRSMLAGMTPRQWSRLEQDTLKLDPGGLRMFNTVAYKNNLPEVTNLLERYLQESEEAKRLALLEQIDEL